MISSVLRSDLILLSVIANVASQTGIELIGATDFDNPILRSLPCIQEICVKYFNTGQPLGGSIILLSLNPRDTILQHKLLNILNRDFQYDWTVMVKDRNPETDYESIEKAKNYFTIVDKSEDILDIINKWKSLSTWNPLAQVVILMGEDWDPDNLESDRRNLMILLLQNRVLNAYIVSWQRNASRVEVATLFPYESDNCADSVFNVALMDTCEYDPEVDLTVESDNIVLWEVDNHFEAKIPNDLHQCPLMVSARLWEPYVLSDANGEKFSSGIDFNIVTTFTERLNMELVIIPQNTNIYTVYDEIVRGSFDLMIGGVNEDPSMRDYLSSTVAYYQDDLTWCVAKAGSSVTWMKIWDMFDRITWFCILMFLILSTLLIFAFQKYINKENNIVRSWLVSMSIILNQPLLIRKYTLSFRFAIIGFVIFGMIVNIMYQSILITTLTKPSSDTQINELRQLLELKLRVFGDIDIIRHLEKNDPVQSYIRDNLESCISIDECLIALSYDEKRAVAASREHVTYNSRIDHENIYCFSVLENIYSYLVTMVAIKNFHLLDKFNKMIRFVSEAGLISKWKSELDHSIKLGETLKKERENGPKPLTFSELYGIFLIASVLLGISVLIFIFELIVARLARNKCGGAIWVYIDQKLLTNREKYYLN